MRGTYSEIYLDDAIRNMGEMIEYGGRSLRRESGFPAEDVYSQRVCKPMGERGSKGHLRPFRH